MWPPVWSEPVCGRKARPAHENRGRGRRSPGAPAASVVKRLTRRIAGRVRCRRLSFLLPTTRSWAGPPAGSAAVLASPRHADFAILIIGPGPKWAIQTSIVSWPGHSPSSASRDDQVTASSSTGSAISLGGSGATSCSAATTSAAPPSPHWKSRSSPSSCVGPGNGQCWAARSNSGWRPSRRTKFTLLDLATSAALLRYAYARLEDLAAGGDPDVIYGRDIWDARRLGIEPHRGPHRVSFTAIKPAWLRNATKA